MRSVKEAVGKSEETNPSNLNEGDLQRLNVPAKKWNKQLLKSTPTTIDKTHEAHSNPRIHLKLRKKQSATITQHRVETSIWGVPVN